LISIFSIYFSKEFGLQKLLVDGDRVSLLIWYESEGNEDEVTVYFGVAKCSDNQTVLLKDDGTLLAEVEDEWFEKIKPVPPDLVDIIGDSKYYISLFMGDLPESIEGEPMKKTGLKWPEEE
jgi:hypothetical protein